MADPDVYSNPDDFARVTNEYDELQTEFKNSDGYQYESDTRSVLHGMRFYPEDYDKHVTCYPVDKKRGLHLPKCCLVNQIFLILDEPTNHLDIETLGWLEKYLVGYEGALLIVSHDRYFLDEIVTLVYEVSRTKVTKYIGNYTRLS